MDDNNEEDITHTRSISEQIRLSKLHLPLSPQTQHRLIDRAVEHEEQNDMNKWESCCFKIDKRVLVFFTQYIIILLTLIFSMRMVLNLDSCEGGVFLNLITFLIGIVVPTPSIKNKDKK